MHDLPNTKPNFYWRTGDYIRVPLPVIVTDVQQVQQPTAKYQLANRQTSEWVLVDE